MVIHREEIGRPIRYLAKIQPYLAELNYLSNITPQHKNLNQGPWKKLEDAVRASVKYRESLFVITEPIYEAPPYNYQKQTNPIEYLHRISRLSTTYKVNHLLSL